MQLVNSRRRWGAVSVTFHWLVAGLIGVMIGLGLIMVELPLGSRKLEWYALHKSLGITVLALMTLRFGWRLVNPTPPLPDDLRPYERGLAKATHAGLYILLLAMPLSGWLMASASPLPTSLWGWFPLPRLIGTDDSLVGTLASVHRWLGYAILAVLALHIAAALKHHFVLKDDTLRRMLPVRLRAADQAGSASSEGS